MYFSHDGVKKTYTTPGVYKRISRHGNNIALVNIEYIIVLILHRPHCCVVRVNTRQNYPTKK